MQRSAYDPSRHGPGRNSQCSRPLLTQCDVVSLGRAQGKLQRPVSIRTNQAAPRACRLPYDRLNLREIACSGSIASRQPRQVAPAPSKKECSA